MPDADALADHAREIAREARAVADEADELAIDLRYEAGNARRLRQLASHTVDWRDYLTLVRRAHDSGRWRAALTLVRLAALRLLT
jgi:hypothetical protein